MSRVGETGVGEMGIGKTGVGEMGVGETGPNRPIYQEDSYMPAQLNHNCVIQDWLDYKCKTNRLIIRLLLQINCNCNQLHCGKNYFQS